MSHISFGCALSLWQLRQMMSHIWLRPVMRPMTRLPILRLLRFKHLTKLRRLQSRREPASSGLIGAAWSDFAVEVVVGEQIFPVIVDTGSSTFAVPARPVAGCQSFYTGVCEGRALEARYGSANWTGRVCFGPEVEVAGLGAGRISFAGIFVGC
eukprot:g26904.t1